MDVLKDTGYEFDEKETLMNKNFEGFLIKHLAEVYQDLFSITPVAEIVELFALRYTYHNLKVLLKQRFSGEDLEQLLIPIGKYSIASLEEIGRNRRRQRRTSDSDRRGSRSAPRFR